MKVFDFFILVVLFLLLISGGYLLYLHYTAEDVALEEFRAQIGTELPRSSNQFYSNMRYPSSEISYSLSQSCSVKRRADFLRGVEYLEERTILDFYEVSRDAEISVVCSNLAPRPDEEGHFIAGEGGPSFIINSSKYSVITSGRIALYRPETCEESKIAVHEMLHALGFDHNGNEESIMFPITNCDQELDQEIIDEIRRLYSEPSVGDLLIENIVANITGRYLNFDITVANVGLRDITDSGLYIYVGGEVVEQFELKDIDLGAKRHLSVTNLRVPRGTQNVRFLVRTSEPELTTANNEATLTSQT